VKNRNNNTGKVKKGAALTKNADLDGLNPNSVLQEVEVVEAAEEGERALPI